MDNISLELIDKILNGKKIRYEYLDELFKKYKKFFPKMSVINIFIDLPYILNQLYNPENIKNLSILMNKSDKYSITSNLLNLAGHYRHYFASRMECYTNIVFMYNSKIDKKIKEIDKDYNKTYYEKRYSYDNAVFGDLNLLIKDNIKIMKLILEHVPNCSFADSEYMDYRCIFPYMVEKEEFKDNINIILTDNKLMYQNLITSNTLILTPKLDKSLVITLGGGLRHLLGKSKTIEKHPEYLAMNIENIPIMESMVNHKKNDTLGIKNFGYLKALAYLYKNNIDVDRTYVTTKIIDELFADKFNDVELNIIKNNFKIYNNYLLSSEYKKDLDLKYPKFIKYIENNDDLRKVNETLFRKNPILIDFLFDGE